MASATPDEVRQSFDARSLELKIAGADDLRPQGWYRDS